MTIELRPYRSRLLERLTIPSEAAHYINAALEDSVEMFLEAVKDVAQAHQMTKIARKSGVAREALYRSLSVEGNPTLDTLVSVLNALGLKIAGVTDLVSAAGLTPSGLQAGPETARILEPEIPKGNIPKQGFVEAGAGVVRYVLPDVVNVLGTGADLYPNKLKSCVVHRVEVDVQEGFIDTIPPYLLSEENESGSYKTSSAAKVN